MTARGVTGLLLALDTATSRAVLALGAADGTLLAADTWPAGHRHVEELLPRLEALLAGHGWDRGALSSLAGIASTTAAAVNIRPNGTSVRARERKTGVVPLGVTEENHQSSPSSGIANSVSIVAQ